MATTVEKSEAQKLRDEVKTLKAKVSELGNQNNRLSHDLGAAHKALGAAEKAKDENKGLRASLEAKDAQISRLQADLNSAQARGGRDTDKLAAAKQVADGLKRLAG